MPQVSPSNLLRADKFMGPSFAFFAKGGIVKSHSSTSPQQQTERKADLFIRTEAQWGDLRCDLPILTLSCPTVLVGLSLPGRTL
jgi:hypothetical protein